MSATSLTAQAVADLVGGRLSGAGDVVLHTVRALAVAEPGSLSVCTGSRWLSAMAETRASAVLLTETHIDEPGPPVRIVVADPMGAIARVAEAMNPDAGAAGGIHPTAIVGQRSTIGAGTTVGAYVVIGAGVTIGTDCRIGAGVVIEDDVRIGDAVQLDPRAVIHWGAVLGNRVHCKSGSMVGGPGFGFLSDETGHQRIPQVGGCILGDAVEIGAGSCVDRGSLDDTVIGAGTKIDNLVHVAHNVRIGEHCLLMAGVGVSGSTKIGDRVILAGQAGLVGHIDIGDDAKVGAQAGVISSVPAGGVVSGFPARPHREFLRATAALYRLADKVDALERLADEQPDE